MAEKIIETAYAKINLGLRILGKRPDGYHEVSMIMQSVGLSDEIIITEGQGIQISTNIEGLSCGEDNLAYKAAALLAKEYNITPNVHIILNKRIFMAAGLAGGSSDAAAVLRGLNRYWNLNLHGDKLEALAAKLGSDDQQFFLCLHHTSKSIQYSLPSIFSIPPCTCLSILGLFFVQLFLTQS